MSKPSLTDADVRMVKGVLMAVHGSGQKATPVPGTNQQAFEIPVDNSGFLVVGGSEVQSALTSIDYNLDYLYSTSGMGFVAFDNNEYLKWEDSLGSTEIDVLKLDNNDNVILKSAPGKSVFIEGDVFINDLTVTGTTTILNTEELYIEDHIVTLNSTVTGTPTLDAGIEIERGSETNVQLLWDESSNGWKFGLSDGTFSFDMVYSALRYIGGNPSFRVLKESTASGNDGSAWFCAGDDFGVDRGAVFGGYGVDHPTSAGKAFISAGIATNAHLDIKTAHSTADLRLYPNNTLTWIIQGSTGTIYPNLDRSYNLGASNRYIDEGYIAEVFSDSINVANDVVIGGSLTVAGTTTTLNTEQVFIEDNIVTLNSNVSGTPSVDAGIEINRGAETNAQLLWDESDDSWKFGVEGLFGFDFTSSSMRHRGSNDSFSILNTTTSGGNTRSSWFCGGENNGVDKGGLFGAYGNQTPSSAGRIFIAGGNVSTGLVDIYTTHSAADIRLRPNTAIAWIAEGSTGDFIPGATSTYNIGKSGRHVGTLFVDDIQGWTPSGVTLNDVTLVDTTVSGSTSVHGETTLKTHTGYSGSEVHQLTAAVTTSGDGDNTMFTLSLEDDSAYNVKIDTICRTDGGTFRTKSFIEEMGLYREAGGSATQMGTRTIRSKAVNGSGVTTELNLNANDFEFAVNGKIGEVIHWVSRIEYHKVSTAV